MAPVRHFPTSTILRLSATLSRRRLGAGDLGRIEEGHAALTQVAAEFRARELAYDGALVNLELSVVELDQGRSARVKQRAVEMWWIFRAGGLHREALAALELFCQAAQQEAATAELARRIQEFLERAQHDQALRFQG